MFRGLLKWVQNQESPLQTKDLGSGKHPQSGIVNRGRGGHMGTSKEKRVAWDLINGTKLRK